MLVHNGKSYTPVNITPEMVGHKVGSPERRCSTRPSAPAEIAPSAWRVRANPQALQLQTDQEQVAERGWPFSKSVAYSSVVVYMCEDCNKRICHEPAGRCSKVAFGKRGTCEGPYICLYTIRQSIRLSASMSRKGLQSCYHVLRTFQAPPRLPLLLTHADGDDLV